MSKAMKLVKARLREIAEKSTITKRLIEEAIENDDHDAEFFFLSYEDEERSQSPIEKEIGMLVAIYQELKWRVKDCEELQAIEKSVKYFRSILGPQ